jgi:hypothetical protein
MEPALPVMFSVVLVYLSRKSMVQIPVFWLYVPTEGVTVTSVNPAGIMSLIWMLVALSGPLQYALIMKVTVSPTFTVTIPVF